MKKQLIVCVLALAAVACSKNSQPPAPPAQPQSGCPAGDNSCPTSKTDAAKPAAPAETKTSAAPKAAEAPAIVQQPAPTAPAKS